MNGRFIFTGIFWMRPTPILLSILKSIQTCLLQKLGLLFSAKALKSLTMKSLKFTKAICMKPCTTRQPCPLHDLIWTARDVNWRLHAVRRSPLQATLRMATHQPPFLELCHDKLTDADTPKEEMDEELAVIATQLAYAYQLQGYVEDAKEIYQSVIDLG